MRFHTDGADVMFIGISTAPTSDLHTLQTKSETFHMMPLERIRFALLLLVALYGRGRLVGM